MTGWLLFVGLVCVLTGFAVGLGLGIYFSAKGVAKMVEKGARLTLNTLQWRRGAFKKHNCKCRYLGRWKNE